MNLKHLNDSELLSQTQKLVVRERELLTQVLHHLCEVDRRKLYCDLRYKSLFEYAVKELHYSEGQAGRRILAMRLIKEIPEVEKQIATGKLSLTNISQAQSYFREVKIHSQQKRQLLAKLENKSSREGQKVFLSLRPQGVLPKEKERQVSEQHIEMRFVIDEKLKNKLEKLRGLLGYKGASMTLAELVDFMTDLSLERLQNKKAGKVPLTPAAELSQSTKNEKLTHSKLSGSAKIKNLTRLNQLKTFKNPRYVKSALKRQIWQRDQGQCTNCGSLHSLQFDHIKPIGLGGESTLENLRLLCFACNQRQAIKTFGLNFRERLKN